jgi:metal-sulfur cluster biosynthetic enzyme
MTSEKEIMKALKKVIDPETGIDVVTMKMIKSAKADAKGNTKIKFKPTTPFCPMIGYLTEQMEQAAKSVNGIKKVEVEVV